MTRPPTLSIAVTSVAVLGFAAGCLPSDDRPPPGSITFTVSPSDAVRSGVVTEDGWTLSFSRLLIDIGRTGLGEGCAEYEEARYDRLLDVTKGSRQKLSLIYGLGQCDVRFRIGTPNTDTLLGVGVTQSDKALMGTYGTDAYARSTVSVLVEGHAVGNGADEKFSWAFRRGFRLTECRAAGDAGAVPPIVLQEHDTLSRDIVIQGEALFRDGVDPSAKLRFSPFADADRRFGNDDGVVDLDELAFVALASAVAPGGGLDGGSARDAGAEQPALADALAPYSVTEGGSFHFADGAAETVETLRDFVYVLLLPTLPRLEGTARCVSTGPGRFR